MSKFLIIGASKGLGLEVLKQTLTESSEYLLACRNIESIDAKIKNLSNLHLYEMDCTKEEMHSDFFAEIKKFSPSHIFYFSGGGPHGHFSQKAFKDHLWAYRLNLLFPAQLLHFVLNNLHCQQIIFTGSSVCESDIDIGAASYASAKHGLKGLISTVVAENPSFDLRLFSPSYMKTSLLPGKAPVFEHFHVDNPAEIAKVFKNWANDTNGARHYLIPKKELSAD